MGIPYSKLHLNSFVGLAHNLLTEYYWRVSCQPFLHQVGLLAEIFELIFPLLLMLLNLIFPNFSFLFFTTFFQLSWLITKIFLVLAFNIQAFFVIYIPFSSFKSPIFPISLLDIA